MSFFENVGKGLQRMNPFKKKKEDEDTVMGTTIHIRVFRQLSDKIPICILEFDATQTKDDSDNYLIQNSEYNFKEELDIVEHPIIEILKERLALSKGDKNERLKTINLNITNQEKLVADLKKGKVETEEVKTLDEETGLEGVENKTKNVIDEETKLRQLKILKFYVENEGDGSYESINIKGKREMWFLNQNGLPVPIKYNAAEHSLYPNVATRRKFYKENSERFMEQFMREKDTAFSGILRTVVTVAIIALSIFFIIGNIELHKQKTAFYEMMDKSNIQELYNMAEANPLMCAYYYTELMKDNSEITDYAIRLLMNRTILPPNIKTPSTDVQQFVDLTKKITGQT